MAKTKPKTKLSDTLVGAADLAGVFGIAKSSIHEWWALPDAPAPVVPGPRPRWRLGDIVQWRVGRLAASAGSSDLRDELDRARIELTKTRNSIESLKLAKSQGEMVTRDQYKFDLITLCDMFKNIGDSCGGDICAEIANHSARDIKNAVDAWWGNKFAELHKRFADQAEAKATEEASDDEEED